ncbi:hypothetical protein [Luteipulveratus mongoliensis]|nr:hypothetical protein [Luteipulveratus mongoliensis]
MAAQPDARLVPRPSVSVKRQRPAFYRLHIDLMRIASASCC